MKRITTVDEFQETRQVSSKVRRRWAVAGGVCLLLLAADTAAWWVACGQVEAGLGQAIGAAGRDGWTVTAGETRWRGWPLAALVERAAVSVRGDAMVFPAGLAWSAERMAFRVNAWAPTRLDVAVSGQQTLAVGGSEAVGVRAARFDVAIDLRGQAPARASLAGVEATLPGGVLGAERLAVELLPGAVAVSAAVVTLPGARIPAIETVRFTAGVSPALVARESAAAWRDAGGRVTVVDGSVRWAGLAATGSGSGGLDGALQPEGDLSVAATGAPALLDALAQAGVMAPAAAVAAKAVLSILAAPARGGPVPLPVSLRGGLLTVAGIGLVRFAPLAWD